MTFTKLSVELCVARLHEKGVDFKGVAKKCILSCLVLICGFLDGLEFCLLFWPLNTLKLSIVVPYPKYRRRKLSDTLSRLLNHPRL